MREGIAEFQNWQKRMGHRKVDHGLFLV